jgi:hypothetical protein
LFAIIFVAHLPLLRLPYFWDEAGYFVPAARDLLLHGSLIPHSTLSNAHPPLVMIWLALCWKFAGFTPAVTRTAMLLSAAFALLGVYRLATLAANSEVAVGATLCTAAYPVFFANSSLAQLDVAAAGLTFWALSAYIAGRRPAAVTWFCLAVLAKETAILAPLALLVWELVCPWVERRRGGIQPMCAERRLQRSLLLLFTVMPLAAWFGYHLARTGYALGNPEFFRYNVTATLHPLRIALAALFRLWQLLGYMNLFMVTVAAALAMMYPPLRGATGERPRISFAVQASFAAVMLAYVLGMSVVGGAMLARYMLPVVPLVIILCISTLWRRIRAWRPVLAIVLAGLAAGLFVNPPYGFAMEDNLAYRDYVLLHQQADAYVSHRYGGNRVLTAWPASDELAHPFLGYVSTPLQVVQVEDFTLPHLEAAAELRSDYAAALLFSTKYQAGWTPLNRWRAWLRVKERFFGYHQDVPPLVGAQLLGGRIVYELDCGGQWVAVIEIDRAVEARVRPATRAGHAVLPRAGSRQTAQPSFSR